MAIFSRGFSGRPRESNPDLPPGQFLQPIARADGVGDAFDVKGVNQ